MAYRGLFWLFYIWPPYGAYGYLLAASLLLDGYSLCSGLCVFPLSGLSLLTGQLASLRFLSV